MINLFEIIVEFQLHGAANVCTKKFFTKEEFYEWLSNMQYKMSYCSVTAG